MSMLITAVYGGSCDACLRFDRVTSVRKGTGTPISLNLSYFSITTFHEIHFGNLLLRVNAPCLCLYFKSRHSRAKRSGNSLSKCKHKITARKIIFMELLL